MTEDCRNNIDSLVYKLPMSVHVMYHENYAEGDDVFNYIYSLLCRNVEQPQIDGLDIPVYRYKGGESTPIPQVNLDITTKVVIIPLITMEMYCDSYWYGYFVDLLKQIENLNNCLLLPIASCEYALNYHPTTMARVQMMQFTRSSILEKKVEFEVRLFDDLIRFLRDQTDKLTVFISHSKRDSNGIGVIRARELREFLCRNTQLNSFFDVNDIPDGRDFSLVIEKNIEKAAVIIIDSKTYSEREWCRIETLQCKGKNVPAIRVDVLEGITMRSFPYMANIPTIRFNDNWDIIVSLLLKTVLNQYYQQQYLTLCKQHVSESARRFRNMRKNNWRQPKRKLPTTQVAYCRSRCSWMATR